jgi:hypothetical protein
MEVGKIIGQKIAIDDAAVTEREENCEDANLGKGRPRDGARAPIA